MSKYRIYPYNGLLQWCVQRKKLFFWSVIYRTDDLEDAREKLSVCNERQS